MGTRTPAATIQGIQATNVYGDAIAVGDHPTVNYHAYGSDAECRRMLNEALSRIEAALDSLTIDATVRESIRQETRAMTTLVREKKVEPDGFREKLASIKDKLSTAGVVIADVVALASPIRAIADGLKIPLAAIGI